MQISNSCHIRAANTDDAVELARLRWAYRAREQQHQAEAEFLAQCTEWLKNALQSGQWLVAVAAAADDTLQGCMYLQCVHKVPVPGEIERAWGYITNAYVSASHRGAGLGRLLLELLIKNARERGLEFLIVWPSNEAVSFYERAGFCSASEIHDRPDDYPPLELEL